MTNALKSILNLENYFTLYCRGTLSAVLHPADSRSDTDGRPTPYWLEVLGLSRPMLKGYPAVQLALST